MQIDVIVVARGYDLCHCEAAGGGWTQNVCAGEAGWRRKCAIRD